MEKLNLKYKPLNMKKWKVEIIPCFCRLFFNGHMSLQEGIKMGVILTPPPNLAR